MNPNTPVIVGVAQIQQRVSDPLEGKEPIDLMVDAVTAAAADCGNNSILAQVNSVRVIRGAWRSRQPAGYVAEKIGSSGAEKVGTCYGGNMVQSALNASAVDVLQGTHDVIVLTGAEIGNSQAKARKLGVDLPMTQTEGKYDRMIGKEEPMSNEAEIVRQIRDPIQMYPIFENAIRFSQGETLEAHIRRVSEMCSRFSDVAADNPDAWLRESVDAESIRTAGPTNRMVSFPYPKLMNSNNSVDMAAAIILCSVEKARSMGIDESKWVYPWTGTDAHDTYFVSERDNLHSSPAIRIAGSRALEMAGLGVDDLDFVDVYSCFPSAVQVASNELGLSQLRPLTVTGGMTFGGGPLNNYVMHSIARMIDVLRQAPGKKGFVTANGGFLTKHAFGVYSTEPPATDYQHENLQNQVDQCPTREFLVDYSGDITIESYTVMYDGDEPSIGHAACLTPDGKRTWANTTDVDVMKDMASTEYCGRLGNIDGKGNLTVV